MAASHAWYAREVAAGVDRFLEPSRADCPWCGSSTLAVLLRTGDRFQGKPGRFTLAECRGCGHVFQNPRLTPEGLSFYYRDFYDGHGEALWDFNFRQMSSSYRGRARLFERHGGTPGVWLDVGAGHGHFCGFARRHWPQTVFHGLDQGAGIDKALRQGWIDRAYRGSFVDLSEGLPGRYDVVSMHHYLEHTRDPFAELDAAVRVLAPGGHLLIEVPDPQWSAARLMGRYWLSWSQPQHQHLIPVGNLVQALAARGLVTVEVERGAAHAWGGELCSVLYFGCLRAVPGAPWKPRRARWLRRALWPFLLVPAALALPAAMLFDRLLVAVARRSDRGNAFRLLARKAD
ncbi:class I SAM-dependent methyltransferase [Streptomyces piniterrae]|uniref:Class I SAM-dependent methyltransferase n=1 Tax=Streptomyces piniterrae TaxID=2571125 RepID=A0A4U0MUB5_9ACTN|nr:class I SAM-dependent methyltransferase [Streptomyces piniterrae]TJZ44595.1 class I SAM-dependent methyltransferase [Streptomyces piniterrae]